MRPGESEAVQREQELAEALASFAASVNVNAKRVREACEALCHAIATTEIAVVNFGEVADALAPFSPAEEPEPETAKVVSNFYFTRCTCGAGPDRLWTWHPDPPGWTCRECGLFIPRSDVSASPAPEDTFSPNAQTDNPKEAPAKVDRGQAKR